MKTEWTAPKAMPVRANWLVTPSPQSSTQAAPLLSITCEVMRRIRPREVGAGPAPVPSSTSFVPLASLSCARTCSAGPRPANSCAATGIAAARTGDAANPPTKPRRVTPAEPDVSLTGYLPSDPAIEMIAAGFHARRQRQRRQLWMVDPRLADKHTRGAQQRRKQRRQLAGERPAGGDIAGPGVEMGESDPTGKAGAGRGQGLPHVTEQQEFGRW